MSDPIVDEVRRHRDEHAKQFGYDLDKTYADLVERQKRHGNRLVRLQPKRPANKTMQATPGGAPDA